MYVDWNYFKTNLMYYFNEVIILKKWMLSCCNTSLRWKKKKYNFIKKLILKYSNKIL